MKIKLIPILLITISVLSCKTQKVNTETAPNKESEMEEHLGITNTEWILTELEGEKVALDQAQDRNIRFILNAEDNTFNGFFGCNSGFGNFSLEEGNRIRFSQIGVTRMACPEESIKESQVLEVFNIADNYTLDGNTLRLNVGRRAPLAVFKKAEVQKDLITEKYWKLKTLEGKEVKMADNQEGEIYFILKTNENRLTGFAGCNTFGGGYTLEEGNRIRFSQVFSTMKACLDVDVDEAAFFKVFELTDNYTIDGDILMFNVGRRAPLAVFEAVYLD
ncbi:META domain-containing protein [Arenibacter certesii]|uniref:META domain-containing protein n=1 Tax=Arenibacter certesii TaxID=228955 RepID=A0A918MI38_9FLAO|nr:META domain-containing protein [Arenibacter certesii]GGW26487.1 META domain-containing protein [Arenibacter certesii]